MVQFYSCNSWSLRFASGLQVAVGCLALSIAIPVVAAETSQAYIEEVVVQGELRPRSAQDVPLSLAVIQLQADTEAVAHLEDVLGRVANLNYSSGASRARFFQIRGIGERGQFVEPLNASVGLVVDGVDMSGVATGMTALDVAQIEVFRGPQGTLYGANALAGFINVTTATPTDEFTTRLRLDAGDYGMLGAETVLSGPVTETLGFRIAAAHHEEDGYLENDFLNRDDTNARREQTLRGKLVWHGASTSVTTTLGLVDIDNGYDAFSLDNSRHTLSDEPGEDTLDQRYGSMRVEHGFDDGAVLEGVFGFMTSESDYGYDEDWTFTGFHPDGYTSTDHYARDRDNYTADLRWRSGVYPGWGGRESTWVAGIYGLHQSEDLNRSATFFGDFDSRFEISRAALYVENQQQLSARLRLTLGARVERHESEYADSEGVRFNPQDDLFGGRVLFELDTDRGALLYAGLSRGYKAGGFNTSGTLDADLREFSPESLINLEIGYKRSFFDDRLRLAAALFAMERDDVQISTSIVRLRSGVPEFIEYTDNAASGSNRGAEVEVNWRATQALTLFASLGLLDTNYRDFVNGAGEDLDGRAQAQAPEYQYFVGAHYRFASGLSARLDVEGKGAYFLSDSHDARADAYALLGASIGYERERFAVTLWGRNLLNEDYFVRGFRFGNDPRTGYADRDYTQLGEPRHIGVRMSLAL